MKAKERGLQPALQSVLGEEGAACLLSSACLMGSRSQGRAVLQVSSSSKSFSFSASFLCIKSPFLEVEQLWICGRLTLAGNEAARTGCAIFLERLLVFSMTGQKSSGCEVLRG